MIKTDVIGRLTKDATSKEINGKNVINFSVATDTGYGDSKKALFVECGYWTEKTGILPYLKKGDQVFVSGEPSIREWESNGKSGVSLQLRVHSIELLGGSKKSEESGNQGTIQPDEYAARAANRKPAASEPIDDLPF